MNRAEICVLKQPDKIRFRTFLQRKNGAGLNAVYLSYLFVWVTVGFLYHLANKALERQLANQQFGGLLVLADLAEGDGARAEAVRFLDAAGGRGGRGAAPVAIALGGDIGVPFTLTLRTSAGGRYLARGLLRAGHIDKNVKLVTQVCLTKQAARFCTLRFFV